MSDLQLRADAEFTVVRQLGSLAEEGRARILPRPRFAATLRHRLVRAADTSSRRAAGDDCYTC